MAKTLGVVLKRDTPEAGEAFLRVRRLAPENRYIAVEPEEVELPLGLERVNQAEFERSSELVVVLGGDGTHIHAASLLPTRVIPVLGINLGHLGFMAEVNVDEIERAVPQALAGELPYVDRLRLDANLVRGDESVFSARVLNDVVLSPTNMARLALYRIERDGALMTSLRGDGVVVATPTGSTAYSMAAGGPILTPGLNAIAVTPICPHSLAQRPLVVSTDAKLTIHIAGATDVYATFDGQVGTAANPGDHLDIRAAPIPTRLLRVPWRDYFQTLRVKLRWGEA